MADRPANKEALANDLELRKVEAEGAVEKRAGFEASFDINPEPAETNQIFTSFLNVVFVSVFQTSLR